MPEESGSALDDSTFEFLGDSMLEASDDEAHTESIASTDGCTPDDASNFSDDDVDYPNHNPEMQHSIPSFHAEALEQHHDSRSTQSAGDSTLTEVPAYVGFHGDSHYIRLDEQLVEELGAIQGSKVDRSFPDDNGFFFDVLKQYGRPQVRLVVKAALSQESISTPDSYRILYVGPLTKEEEEVVSSKICAALTACQSTSRSIMVQGRLQPYSPVMHAYHCTDIQKLSKEDEPTRIAITLDDGKQLTFGPGRSSTSEPRPDLVVFCHPCIPRRITDAQEYASAREVFDREKVPYLDMISAKQYGSGASSYDSRSLSVCIEGRDDSEADFELQEVHPIDYYTFSCLEPSQINRHLAMISPHMLAKTEKQSRTSSVADLWNAYVKKVRAARPAPLKMMILLMALTGMITAYFFSPVLMPMLSETLSNIEVASMASAPSSELCTSSATITMTPPTASVSLLAPPAVKSASRDLSLVPPQARSKKPEKKKGEKMAPFTIETSTDHQFTLVPHKDILHARKKPQLQIRVSRGSQDIPIRFNRTISGVYVVDLEQQEPFGIFNVSIASYSKPLLQQSFEIGLGHNKSSLAQSFDSAIRSFNDRQHKMLNVSTTMARELLAGMASADAVARLWQIPGETGQEVAAYIQTFKDALRRRVSASTEIAKEVPETAWAGVRKATAPVRTSTTMMRARLNALRVRCKVETAAGLSSKDSNGKESWACSKVRGQA